MEKFRFFIAVLLFPTLLTLSCKNNSIQGKALKVARATYYKSGGLESAFLKAPVTLRVGGKDIEFITTGDGYSSSSTPGGNSEGSPMEFYEGGQVSGGYPAQDSALEIGGRTLRFRAVNRLEFYPDGAVKSGILKEPTEFTIQKRKVTMQDMRVSFYPSGRLSGGRLQDRCRIQVGKESLTFTAHVPIGFYESGSVGAGSVEGAIPGPGPNGSMRLVQAYDDKTAGFLDAHNIEFYEGGSVKRAFYMQAISIQGKAKTIPIMLDFDEAGAVAQGTLVFPALTEFYKDIVDMYHTRLQESVLFKTDYNSGSGEFLPPRTIDLELESAS
jgi:hypothetical protein